MTNKFDIDLQYGKVREGEIASMLQNEKIEVKTERDIWKTTGNIVVEFECRGKPSGGLMSSMMGARPTARCCFQPTN